VPALVIDAEIRNEDWEVSEWTRSYIGPGVARLELPDGDILVNTVTGYVAFRDLEFSEWSVEPLKAWQAHVDSLIDLARERLITTNPRFRPVGKTVLVSEYESQRHRLVVRAATPDGIGERLQQDVWVTRDVETTFEIYETYRLVLHLFGRLWLEVPVERPPGILMRARVSRRPADGRLGDPEEVEDSIVRDIGYRLVPRQFFEVEARAVLLQDRDGIR
jgi:hypothetical protein